MKTRICLSSLSLLVLSACGTAPVQEGDATTYMSLAQYEDKGEVLTGSRIPQKSTSHTLKRVGSKEYKQASQANGQFNPEKHSPNGSQ